MPGRRICLRPCARRLRLVVAGTVVKRAARLRAQRLLIRELGKVRQKPACLHLRTRRLPTRAVSAICDALICCHTAPHFVASMVAVAAPKGVEIGQILRQMALPKCSPQPHHEGESDMKLTLGRPPETHRQARRHRTRRRNRGGARRLRRAVRQQDSDHL